MTRSHRLLCSTLLSLAVLALGAPADAQYYSGDGTGARFGTRDPIVCPERKVPASGPISAETAAMYVVCGMKGDQPKSVSDTQARTGTYLYLLDNVRVQVGRARPVMQSDMYQLGEDLDPSSMIYPLQGSYDSYQCMGSASDVKGRNCNLTPVRLAKGLCYKDSFANWNCELGAAEPSRGTQQGVAGPQH